jgi:hypothetical protein
MYDEGASFNRRVVKSKKTGKEDGHQKSKESGIL